MLNPHLTAADVGGLFETTCGKSVTILEGPDDVGEFYVNVANSFVHFVDASGKGEDLTLSHRLPTSDSITKLERAVVEAAVAWQHSTGTIKYVPLGAILDNATHALIAARRPRPRRVDSPEALFDVMTSAGIDSTHVRIKAVFNALPEVGE